MMAKTRTVSRTEIDAVLEQLRPLIDDGQVVELRVIGVDGKNYVDSGYFNNLEDLARNAAAYSGRATGVYFTPNEIEPALLARAANRMRQGPRQTTTSDTDITRYRFFLLDFDPIRPSDISSTDAEHEAALQRAKECADWLSGRGWPQPVFADSGNGAHLLYRIDLPNDQATTHTIQRALQALAITFDDDVVQIDTGVFNPSRIWKAYGTLVCKGDPLEDRPHRFAQVLSVPAAPEPVQRTQLERLAALVPQDEPVQRTNGRYRSSFDLESWIAEHSLDVGAAKPWGSGGKRWIFNVCPWNSAHTNGSAYIIQMPSGAIGAGCHHNSCQGKGWADLRELYDGPRTDRQRAAAVSPVPAAPRINREDFDPLAYRPEDGGVLDAWHDLYQHQWRFATGWDKWLHWNGTHWQIDEELDIHEQVETLLDEMNRAAKAAQLEAKAEIKALGKNDPGLEMLAAEEKKYAALVSATKRTKNRIASIEGMARNRLAVHTKQFNNSNTLNLANGTLDLKEFELRPHCQDDLLTYVLPYEYDGDAECPRWTQFLRDVLVKEGIDGFETDEELIMLYQELYGYSLTIDTSHEIIVFQTGEGSNGKSVSVGILKRLVGELSVALNFAKLGSQGDYDLSRIPGKRVLFSTESVKGSKIPEDIMKTIASGETLPARAPYESPYEFEPVGKIWWSMNHLPRITDTTLSIWRRMKLIPFKRTIPLHDQDPHLVDKLATELPGILNWALWGLYRLREQGTFTKSAAVEAEVDRYKKASNPVQLWVEERTEPCDKPVSAPGKLYDDYQKWCEANGYPTSGRDAVNSRQFTQELSRLGYASTRTGAGYRHPLLLQELERAPMSRDPWE